MEKKGDEIEAEQKRCQVLLAVTKVMLDMIALRLEHVVIFVFDLPPPPTGLGKVGHVVICYGMIGDKAVVVELFAGGRMDRGDLEPIARQSTFATSQEHLVDIAI
jgi:hypothetical protein